ncbi:hypothetical protein NGA_0388800 [Nannochloropsis gaditana CCMP526]|nr:hypothetical protein NGA_0388800 [Nannochloropsis gaditana CCMP526]EKU21425.1 hypothetical protein NGA_0388800 [Nannochloropsis gaditana CCMP526]|eukprot:XP_005854937.1 hypothetical protein NGA_0388800 [Nannochloropsis gaditana CCMP526]
MPKIWPGPRPSWTKAGAWSSTTRTSKLGSLGNTCGTPSI